MEYLAKAGAAVYGAGTPEATAWLDPQRHALTHDDPQGVSAALHTLRARVLTPTPPLPQEVPRAATSPGAVITRSLLYLHKRLAQIQ